MLATSEVLFCKKAPFQKGLNMSKLSNRQLKKQGWLDINSKVNRPRKNFKSPVQKSAKFIMYSPLNKLVLGRSWPRKSEMDAVQKVHQENEKR